MECLAKIPLIHQPGSAWEYSLASGVQGRVVEAASGQRLGDFLSERVFKPLSMIETAFHVPEGKAARIAGSYENDPVNGTPFRLIDVSKPPANDSGGAGAVSTPADYLRFAQMLLNGGTLDGERIMSRTTVRYMSSDHLGSVSSQRQHPAEQCWARPTTRSGLASPCARRMASLGCQARREITTWAGTRAPTSRSTRRSRSPPCS